MDTAVAQELYSGRVKTSGKAEMILSLGCMDAWKVRKPYCSRPIGTMVDWVGWGDRFNLVRWELLMWMIVLSAV